jgi:DMSO/TMAO reductase YedYZ heme-binding membrane subunit
VKGFSGWRIFWVATLAVASIQLAVLAATGTGEEGVRAAIRASARTSLFLFGAAFVASSWHRLGRGVVSRWVLANRRYVGVSFAASHAIHLAAIGWLGARFDVTFAPVTIAVGGLGYVLIAAMTATSFDRTARRLGARGWKRLHGFGSRYVWLVFFLTLLPQSGATAAQLAAFVFVLALAGVRTAAGLHEWRTKAAVRAPRAA